MATKIEFFNEWAVKFMALLIKDFKLSFIDAAAIVGNLGHESDGFSALQERKPLIPGSKGGYGIAQWTGPRRVDFEAYCKRNGLDPADMMTNYKFLFVELKGPEGKSLAVMGASPTLNSKVEAFCNTFLRPGIPHMDSRKIWAARALAAWNNRAKDPVAPAPEPVVQSSLLTKLWNWICSLF